MESKTKKINNDNDNCVDSCNNERYNYEYNGKCYENCLYGYFTDNINKECKCELEKCLTCPTVALKNNLCTQCFENYYQMENDPSNMGEYINCYNSLTGYYLDKEDSLFKKCFDTCETCEIKGDNKTHNCSECKIDYPFSITFNNYSNCYINCIYYYFFDEELNYFCTDNSSCPEEYPLLIPEKRECIKNKEYPTTIIINEKYSSTLLE